LFYDRIEVGILLKMVDYVRVGGHLTVRWTQYVGHKMAATRGLFFVCLCVCEACECTYDLRCL